MVAALGRGPTTEYTCAASLGLSETDQRLLEAQITGPQVDEEVFDDR